LSRGKLAIDRRADRLGHDSGENLGVTSSDATVAEK